uniref:Uncharacterized protein n=1 Tax=Romanomermis culicivorax TaxID=13658 RepID=A0A915KX86_ROMCU
MFCFVVFALLSVVSSKSIFDESLAYIDLSGDLVQAVEKVGVEEANTGRKNRKYWTTIALVNWATTQRLPVNNH